MSKQLLKQALDALKYHAQNNPDILYADSEKLCADIETELAKPEPEPVAWMYGGKLSNGADDFHLSLNKPSFGYKVPLYAEPPARKPLSLPELIAAWNEQADEHNQWDSLDADEKIKFALAQH